MIKIKVLACLDDEDIEVEGKYYPGYESSIVKNYGDQEDKFIITKAYLNDKVIKLSEEQKEELEEELLELAREEFSKIEDDFIAEEDEEEENELFPIDEDEE